jgi:hypothetical protein
MNREHSLRWEGKIWLLGVNNLTSEWLHCKLQTRFLVREDALEEKSSNCQSKKKSKIKSGQGSQREARYPDTQPQDELELSIQYRS